jgi:hypothetical protein
MDLCNVTDDLNQHIRIAHRLSLDWREGDLWHVSDNMNQHKREKQRDRFIDIF